MELTRLVLLLLLLPIVFVFSEDCHEGECGMTSHWMSLFQVQLRSNPQSAGTLSLATVEGGKPRVRTVLFQGLVIKDGREGIAIKTSRESRKVKNSDSNAVECMFWLQETMTQFRLSGNMVYGDDEQETERVWKSLNPAARSQFLYDASAGLDESTRGPIFQEEQVKVKRKGLQAIPSSFVVGVLYPDEIDFLDLSTLERKNFKLEEDGKWTVKQGYAPPVVSTV